MNIIAFDAGRATFLFPVEEMTPLEGYDTKYLLDKCRERYQFSAVPNLLASRAEIEKAGLKFETGRFQYKDGIVEIFQFDIYTDGLLAGAKTTEHAEAFLDDLIAWLIQECGFRPVASKMRRVFTSQVVIEFARPISALVPMHKKITDIITRSVAGSFDVQFSAVMSRIDFEFHDGSGIPRVPKVSIERRAGVSLDQSRYFSSAPLSTSRHIEVLQAIEDSSA